MVILIGQVQTVLYIVQADATHLAAFWHTILASFFLVKSLPVIDDTIYVKAEESTGLQAEIGIMSSRGGRFSFDNDVPAGTVVFTIRADDIEGVWQSEPLLCAPDAVIDLGMIVLAPEEPTAVPTEQE